jgi:hypothetical protein
MTRQDADEVPRAAQQRLGAEPRGTEARPARHHAARLSPKPLGREQRAASATGPRGLHELNSKNQTPKRLNARTICDACSDKLINTSGI